jgi:hypothetical protein
VREEVERIGLRLFLSYRDGVLDTNDVLVDNETCVPGEGAAAATAFDISQGFVTTRVFGLIVPTARGPASRASPVPGPAAHSVLPRRRARLGFVLVDLGVRGRRQRSRLGGEPSRVGIAASRGEGAGR